MEKLAAYKKLKPIMALLAQQDAAHSKPQAVC